MNGLGCCLLIYKESCLWFHAHVWSAWVERLGFRLSKASVWLMRGGSTQGYTPPLPLSCTVYQITQYKMETEDQMISNSFFYLLYIWEVEDILRIEFTRNFWWDARQFRYKKRKERKESTWSTRNLKGRTISRLLSIWFQVKPIPQF